MNPETALANYSKAVQAVKDHQEANKPVFDAHSKLMLNVIDTENDLRDAVAETGQSISNGMHRITVTPQTQEVWDEEATLKALGMTKDGAIKAGFVKQNERPARITIGEVSI